MKTLIYDENTEKVGTLILNSGSGNPLTPELIKELDKKIEEIEKSPPKVLILHGGDGKIFSGGFSLPHIFAWERKQMDDFFGEFTKALTRLITLKCPTLSAVNGHAVAAGFILTLGTDLRVLTKGKLKLGFTEVDIGVGVPYGTQVLFALRTNPQASLRYTMLGELFNPEVASSIGHADFLAENATEKAMEVANHILAKPGSGVSETKSFYAQKVAEDFKKAEAATRGNFLDSWFSPEAQKSIKAMAEKLSKK